MLDAELQVLSMLARQGHARAAEAIWRACEDAVWLETDPHPSEDPLPGTTRLGGLPDLLHGQPWPRIDGRPLAFLAQVNLAQMRGLRGCAVLPSAGVLQFFCDVEALTSEQLSTGVPGQAVIWQPAVAPHRTPSAAPGGVRTLAPRKLIPHPITTLPPWDSQRFRSLNVSDAERIAFFECIEAIQGGVEGSRPAASHQLLGHPLQLGHDMEAHCQRLSGPHAAREPWRLLLQFESDPETGISWGQPGLLCFWIRDADLAVGRFDRTRVLWQPDIPTVDETQGFVRSSFSSH